MLQQTRASIDTSLPGSTSRPAEALTGLPARQEVARLWQHNSKYFNQLQWPLIVGAEGAEAFIWPVASSGQAAVATVFGTNWSVAAADPRKPVEPVVAELLRHLPEEGALLSAPEPLGGALAQAWNAKAGRKATAVAFDMLWQLERRRLTKVPVESPCIVNASEIGVVQASREMAQCWLKANGAFQKPEAFEALLDTTQALLYRRDDKTVAFQLYTPMGAGHAQAGGSCGELAQLPQLFSRLCQTYPKLTALSGMQDLRMEERLLARRFKPTGQAFGTYVLA